MKKIIAAAVTVTTVLSLAACGGNTAVDSPIVWTCRKTC